MEYRVVHNCNNVDWNKLVEVISKAGLSTQTVERTELAFRNSALTIFIYDKDILIGSGRAISDGVYQAGIYDIAVLPEYQGKGIGRIIMNELHNGLKGYNVILYARSTAVDFYRKLGYSKMLTGMAKFKDPDHARERKLIE
jgi:aralkylamine N-acetyltransferase